MCPNTKTPLGTEKITLLSFSESKKMKKYISLVVGYALFFGGSLVILTSLFMATRAPLLLMFTTGFLSFVGATLVWVTLSEWSASKGIDAQA